MPYIKKYVRAKLFLKYKGVKIYHVYRDDEFSRGIRTYIYDTREDSAEVNGFDVRDLASYKRVLALADAPLDPDTEEGRKHIIKLAINAGILYRRRV